METKVSLPEDDLNVLRSKLKDQPPVQFNRKLVGGVDPTDVVKYISKINEQLQKSEESYHTRIEEITNSNKVLLEEVEKYKHMFEEAQSAALQLQGVKRQVQEENAILREKLDNAANNLSDNTSDCVSVSQNQLEQLEKQMAEQINLRSSLEHQLEIERSRIKERDEEIQDLEVRLGELEAQLEESNRMVLESEKVQAEFKQQDINTAAPDLENRIFGLRGAMEAFQQHLLEQEELAKANKELRQQLDCEISRADKAEKKLAEFCQVISSLEKNLS